MDTKSDLRWLAIKGERQRFRAEELAAQGSRETEDAKAAVAREIRRDVREAAAFVALNLTALNVFVFAFILGA